MLAVEHMTSKATHVSQNCAPKTQYPRRSFTPANVITREATKRSAMAKEARNRFPIRRRPRSVYIATHTKMFPATDKNISNDRNVPTSNMDITVTGSLFSSPSLFEELFSVSLVITINSVGSIRILKFITKLISYLRFDDLPCYDAFLANIR